jgi:predicted tellurium resistance membrane protein TerC
VGAAVECATAAAKAMTTHAWAFWSTVFVIEMTDIAFAVDSIVAAVGLVPNPHPEHAGPHPKLWVIITGGFLGVVLMRFAAVIFIRLLERFPRFETSAYLLVCVIGAKLVVDWQWGAHAAMPGPATRPATAPTTAATQPAGVNFHDPSSLAFWVFWGLMAACFCIGFIRPRRKAGEQA